MIDSKYIDFESIQKVVRNNELNPEELEALSNSSNKNIRSVVALNEHTPITALRELSKDTYSICRANAAENKNLPFDCLKNLVKDLESVVRESSAFNSQCTYEMLKELSQDKEWNVRDAVARSDITPPDILESLSYDSEPLVRESVLENKSTLEQTKERIKSEWVAKIEWIESKSVSYYLDIEKYETIKKEYSYCGVPMECTIFKNNTAAILNENLQEEIMMQNIGLKRGR